MPFEKKSKRGQPKGTITTGYTYLTTEEKEAYHSDAVREHWQNTLAITAKPKAPPKTVKNKNTSKFPEAGLSSSGKLGWKPVNNNPFSPNTRHQRKLQSQKRICHKNKISKTRTIIATSLWNKWNNSTTEDGFNSDNSQCGNSVTSTNSQPDDMDIETNIEDGVESDSEEDTTIPSTTKCRYWNTLKSYLPLYSLDSLNIVSCFLSKITCPCLLKS